MKNLHAYRLYADGRLVHEDDFEEEDNALPYYDDYAFVVIDMDTLPDEPEEEDIIKRIEFIQGVQHLPHIQV